MAKISDDDLEVGRRFIREMDLDGLMYWCKLHVPNMNLEIVEQTYRKVFAAKDPEKGLKLFDATMADYDQAEENLRKKAKKVFGCFGVVVTLTVFIGAVGGVVYLVKAIF